MSLYVNRGDLSSLVRQPGGKVRYQRDGTIIGVERYVCLYSRALALAPKRNVTKHPVFPELVCKEVEITALTAGRADIMVTYIGDPGGGSLSDLGATPPPSYGLTCETGSEPIETFPNFSTTIGLAANGAKYDSNNLFLGYEKTSAYVGISDWLVPGQVWQEAGFLRNLPSADQLARVGKIDTPSGSISTPSGRNWLLRSFNCQQEGLIFPYTKQWQLSGPRGWNTTIYAAS